MKNLKKILFPLLVLTGVVALSSKSKSKSKVEDEDETETEEPQKEAV